MTTFQAKSVLINLRDRLKKSGAKPGFPVGKSQLEAGDVDGMAYAMTEDLLEDVRKGKMGEGTSAKIGFLYGMVVARGHATLEELTRYEKTAAPLASLDAILKDRTVQIRRVLKL